jgi:archaellum component FlaC
MVPPSGVTLDTYLGEEMQRRSLNVWLAILLSFVMLAAACGDDGDADSPSDGAETPDESEGTDDGGETSADDETTAEDDEQLTSEGEGGGDTDALSKVCETQDSVDEDLAALDALDPVTDSAEDYFAALDNLKESANDLLSASLDLIGQDIENINNADSDLQDSLAEATYTLDGVREVTLAEAGSALVTGVETQIAELEAFYAEAYAGSSCS